MFQERTGSDSHLTNLKSLVGSIRQGNQSHARFVQALALIKDLEADLVIADTAYDSQVIREAVAEKDAFALIPNNC